MNYKTTNKCFDDLVINIKTYFSNKKNIILFQKRNVIKIVDFNGEKYVVKSFKIPHLINKIVYKFFRDSKAKRSYENSVKLIELNINTPKPIGYIEFSSIAFFKDSYYISSFFDYDFEIRAVFKDKNFKDREKILRKFIEFTFDIHNKGVYHVDYSPGNILVKIIDAEYIFYVIDVNRMKFLEFDIDLRIKSISKLTSNSDDNNLMITYYSEVSNIDLELLKVRYTFYLNEQQKYLENKKRLKKMKG